MVDFVVFVVCVLDFSLSLSVDVERSARSTFPDLINFRVARLNGFRRIFGNVAPVFFERGIAKPETKVFLFFRTLSTVLFLINLIGYRKFL